VCLKKVAAHMISSNLLFCAECGTANASDAPLCFACKQPLCSPPQSPPVIQHAALAAPAPIDCLSPASLLAQRYRIISQAGQGGFGVVYKAKDRKNKNRLVAIKQIDRSRLSPREIIEATDTYNREVTLLSKLRHENLPCIYDHFADPQHWYVIMEYIQGETLEDYLARRGRLSVRQVLKIGITLSTLLTYLHTRTPPIIFRDVKPANIMRTRRGHLYLIDFGIARRFTPGLKKDTGPLGSPGYAAPEQYGKAQTTVQTDIYGLGATLQTLLTGKDPLESVGGAQPLTRRMIPLKLQALLDQMLEHDMHKRPLSMEEVKGQLQLVRARIMWIENRLLAYAKGLLYGVLPYALVLLLILLLSVLRNLGLMPAFLTFSLILLTDMLYLIFGVQLLVAIHFLFLAGKRLMGLGMLTVLVVLLSFQPMPPVM
jgi:tRNA A-37 threonylcarbamoyl transferase component Bud32